MFRSIRLLAGAGMLAVSAMPATAQTATCPQLTDIQRVAGFATLANTGMTLAIVFGMLCLGFLLFRFGGWLRSVFELVPVQVYEALGYAVSAGLVAGGYWLSPADEVWTSLCGSLFFAVMLCITVYVHKLKTNHMEFFGILLAAWVPVAAFYSNEYVGFIAVAAFMGGARLLGDGHSVLLHIRIPRQGCAVSCDDGWLSRAGSVRVCAYPLLLL